MHSSVVGGESNVSMYSLQVMSDPSSMLHSTSGSTSILNAFSLSIK